MKKYLLRLGVGLVLLVAGWCAVGLSLAAEEKSRLVFDPHIRPLIRQAIASSQTSIDAEIYKISDRDVLADLARAARRGVVVRLILCPSQVVNRGSAAYLRAAGVQARWYPLKNKNQIMHLKLECFDTRSLFVGSPNWTHWGLTLHHEAVAVNDDPQMIKEFQVQFEADWKKSDAGPGEARSGEDAKGEN